MITYLASDYFMVRNSLRPLKDYESTFSGECDIRENLKDKFSEPSINEALIVASNVLSKAFLNNGLYKGTKESQQIKESLIKYFIRLSTRPTPFGLFSGISVGRFGDASEIIISKSPKHIKRARPDMEWIYGVIKTAEANPEIKRTLRIRFNDFSYVNGNRMEKPDKTLLQQSDTINNIHEITSIRYTRLVKRVEEICGDFCKYSELVTILKMENGFDDDVKVESFLNQLLENEFLITELRPPLTNIDALDYMIGVFIKEKHIPEVGEYATKLLHIKNAISSFNFGCIGDGIGLYNEIVQLMGELFKCENYLQVDMKIHTEKNSLDVRLKRELERFVAAMYKIAPFLMISEEMEHYKALFIEKYGYNVEVAVFELLDNDIGLGFPPHYKVGNGREHKKSKSATKNFNSVLNDKIVLALKEGKKVVEVTDKDIELINAQEQSVKIKNILDFPQSFELYFLAHSGIIDTNKESDYYFTVAPAIASGNTARTFGRFRDLLSEDESAYLKEDIEKQKQFLDDYIIAEITELPSSGRLSNVSINESDYDYQIALSTNCNEQQKVLSVKDLYIGVDSKSNSFYIRSKTLDKKVIVTTTNMVNPLLGSGVLRFLREISSIYKLNPISSIASIVNNSFAYTPRIVYGKVIIKPETWIITQYILGCREGMTEDFDNKIKDYRRTYQIPRYVFLNEADKRLLLDLENREHRNIIYNTLKGNNLKSVILSEIGCGFDDFIATDEQHNHYVTEIVVPFSVSPESYDKKNRENEVIPTGSNISNNSILFNKKESMLLPGNDGWLFFKLYGCSKRRNELITLIYDKLERISSLIQKYFYINYTDPEPHVRLRVQANVGMLPEVFWDIMQWFEKLRIDGIISKVTIESYLREVERYGGSKLIARAEECFFENSRFAMEIIKKQRYDNSDFNIDVIGIAFIIFVLDSFGVNDEAKAGFLYTITDRKSYRKLFQQNRKIFMEAVDRGNWFYGNLDESYVEIFALMDKTGIKLKSYATAIYECDKRGELTSSIESILRSVIHMFCNRVGDNAWENKIYILARHAYYALECFLKNR